MRPLTDYRPKPLVPIAGRPILQYNIENLRGAGIRDIVVVINHDAPQIAEHFGDGAALGVRLTYVPQRELLGTAHAVYQAREALEGQPFVLVFGDNMTGYRLSHLVDAYRQHDQGSMLAVSDGGDPQKHAVISVEGDRVRLIEERPKVPRGPFTSAGMFVFDNRIFDAIERIRPVANGEYYLPHAVQLLIDQDQPVYYTVADGWRVNINAPSDMLRALQYVLGDTVRTEGGHPALPGGTEVQLGAGVRFGRNVGFGRYTYIGNECEIGHNTWIANSILMDRVVIGSECCITNAILGTGAVVQDGTRALATGTPLVVPDGQVLCT